MIDRALVQAATTLPPPERLELIDELWRSLEPVVDGIEAPERSKVLQRLAEIDENPPQLTEADAAMTQLRSRLG